MATCLGLIFGLIPEVAAITFAIWVLVTLITKFVSMGSVVAAIVMHLAIFLYYGPVYFEKNPVTTSIFGLLTLFIIIKHRSNIKRVIEGTEPKIGEKAE